jgi:hypothetical protein
MEKQAGSDQGSNRGLADVVAPNNPETGYAMPAENWARGRLGSVQANIFRFDDETLSANAAKLTQRGEFPAYFCGPGGPPNDRDLPPRLESLSHSSQDDFWARNPNHANRAIPNNAAAMSP